MCAWRFSDGSRRALSSNLLYIILGSALGFQAVVLNFLVQVGVINGSGLRGMFDWGMVSLLLDTSLGDVTFLRLAGFVVALVTASLMLRKINRLTQAPGITFFRVLMSRSLIAIFLIALSFKVGGHVSILSTTAQLAVVLHVMAMSAWIGSLYPLLKITQTADMALLQQIMKKFGDSAIVILIVLVVAGVLMLLQLVGISSELFSTAYGLSLVAKLVMVVAILCVAAINKMVLVPQIVAQNSAEKIRTSIRVEMFCASLIFILTSYLATIIAPPGH